MQWLCRRPGVGFFRLTPACALVCAFLLPAQDPETFRTGSQEVIVDVVVRDKKGRLVRDLRPEDFTVTDEDAAQALTSFRLIDRDDQIKGSTRLIDDPNAPRMADARRDPRVVSILLERLGNDSLQVVAPAILDILNETDDPDTWFGIFYVDHNLIQVEPWTNDREKARAAVRRLTSMPPSRFREAFGQSNISGALERAEAFRATGNNAADAIERSSVGESFTQAAMADVEARIEIFAKQTATMNQARSSIFPLFALARETGRLPGRKSILYFTEGWALPPDLDGTLEALIATANRSNVSIYAFDARGLLVESMERAGADLFGRTTRPAAGLRNRSNADDTLKTPIWNMEFAEQSMRLNAHHMLSELSEGTGGFLTANTNDMRAPVKRIVEDQNVHYELSWRPQISVADGRFRRISVKVDRPDVTVQSRAGYYALPASAGGWLMPWDMPLLNVLAMAKPPLEVDFHAAALRFDPKPAGTLVSLVLEVPFSGVGFAIEDGEKRGTKVHRGRLSAMMLVRDAQGNVVDRFSRDLPLSVAGDRIGALRSGHYSATWYTRLVPGRYRVESAVRDYEGKRFGVRKSVLIVPAKRAGVMMSSLCPIRSVEGERAEADETDPLILNRRKLQPSAVTSVRGGGGAQLPLLVTLYPDKSIATPPKLVFEFLKDGAPVGRMQPDLPGPDAQGRIRYVATASLETLSPGLYEVRAVALQGSTAAEERTVFTVSPD